MGHKHEIEVYVMVDEVANLSVEEQCAFFKDKLQKYACMMDIVQGEYEKAYLEVRRTRGLPVYSDTMFKEDAPPVVQAAPAVEPVMEYVPEMVMPEVPEMVMPEVPEMVMPEMVMPEPEPEPEPFVPETIEEHADAVLESIEAMGLPEEPVVVPEVPVDVPAMEMPVEMPAMAEIPVEAPVAEIPVEMPVETPVVAEIPVEVPVAEIPVEAPVAAEIPTEMPVMEAAPAPEAAAPAPEAAPVEMSPDEIAAMLAAAQATA